MSEREREIEPAPIEPDPIERRRTIVVVHDRDGNILQIHEGDIDLDDVVAETRGTGKTAVTRRPDPYRERIDMESGGLKRIPPHELEPDLDLAQLASDLEAGKIHAEKALAQYIRFKEGL